jgi:hypothetical protein
MKSYTDLEQSEVLSKILPHESADFGWNVFVDGTSRILPISDWDLTKDGSNGVKFFHAWSLAALLNVLPSLNGRNAILCRDISCDKWHMCYHSTATSPMIDTERYDNPVDACYDMVLKLKENNRL